MASKETLYAFMDYIIGALQPYDVVVTAQSNAEGLTRFAKSEINQNVFEAKTTFHVTVSQGKRKVSFISSDVDKHGLQTAIDSAKAQLSALPEAQQEFRLVSSPSEISLDQYDGQLYEEFGVHERARAIAECLAGLPRDQYYGSGALSHSEYEMAMGNSLGVRRYYRGNSVTFTALVSKFGGGPGSTKITSRTAGSLDCHKAMQRAYEKASMNADSIEMGGGSYTVILEPLAVNDLMAFVAAIGFSGKSLKDGSSFLCGRMGERIFSNKVDIADDWTHEKTMNIPFDIEGTLRQVVPIIRSGVATGVIHDLDSAASLGVHSTGHAYPAASWGMIPLNLVMAGGEKSLDQLISETDNGLLVTRLHYVNPVNRNAGIFTALTKDGFFHINEGKLSRSVKNMRFTASILDLFSNIEELSSDREVTRWWYPMTSYYLPAMKISAFPFANGRR